MSKIKIGLFGFGVVGEGLHEVLKKAYTADAEIVKICVKHHNKKRTLPESSVLNCPAGQFSYR